MPYECLLVEREDGVVTIIFSMRRRPPFCSLIYSQIVGERQHAKGGKHGAS